MAMLSQVPLERINAEARQLDPARVLLTLLAAPLYALGWVAAKVVMVLWTVVAWSATAARVGWQEARSPASSEGG